MQLRNITARLGLAFAALLLASAAAAPARAQEGAGEEKRRDVKRLLQLMNVGESGVQVFEALLPEMRALYATVMGSLPAAKRERAVAILEEEMRREATPERVVDELIPIYERHLTGEEVKSLIAFYESPAGRKLISVQPQLIKESATIGDKLAGAAARRVVGRFREEGIQIQPPAPRPRRRP